VCNGGRGMEAHIAIAAIALIGLSSPAFAGTASGTLDVTMKVANNCTLASGGGGVTNLVGGGAGSDGVLDFGYQSAGINSAPIDGTSAAGGDIILNCTGDTLTPQISFSAGNNANGGQRRLLYAGGAVDSLVQYNLYIDSGRVTPLLPNQFYDLVPDALATGLKPGVNAIRVYGQIPAGEELVDTGVDFYSDAVNFQVTY